MPHLPRVAAGVAVAVWALLVVGVGAQSVPDDAPIRYRGRVLDTTGGPIPGVDVTCTAKGGVTHRAKTDDTGEYVLAFTTGGCESIVFKLDSFVPERFAFPMVGILDVSLRIGFPGQREWLAGAGRGFVVNDDGSPAVDASVWLWRISGAAAASWRTDKDGVFQLPLTDYDGDFVLCARGAGERQQTTCLPKTTNPFPSGTVRLQLLPPSK